jgi:NitT/TauT family transport system permease protein
MWGGAITLSVASAMPTTAEQSSRPATNAIRPARRREGGIAELFRFRGRPGGRTEIWVGVVGFLVVMGLWHSATSLELVKPQFLPSPAAVAGALLRLFRETDYVWDVLTSVARVWTGFLASAVIAIPLGILMSSYRGIGALIEPINDFIRYLPVPALVPLTLIWLGIGEDSKIALLFIGTFFQLMLLIADDARRVPKEFIETGRTLGAGDWALMKDILLRAMMPNMVDSLRITLGWCWTYLLVAEIVASSSGIGFELWTARRYGKTPEVFAGIFTIGIIGLVSDQLIRALHRRWFRYLG